MTSDNRQLPAERSTRSAQEDPAGTPGGTSLAAVSDLGLPFIAYTLSGKAPVPIVPAPVARSWMKETHKQFAHRCLALLIANQSGWFLLNQAPFRVTWNGGPSIGALEIEYLEEQPESPLVSSQFGQGILTWSVRYLFRTPPGYNLLARGPANMPKDGISALEGVIETDWAVATFTMNWKLTRAGLPVTFERGEPFCMLVPQRRHELEEFMPRVESLASEPELNAQLQEFERRRTLMNQMRLVTSQRAGRPGADLVPWERHYLEGTSPGGWTAGEHQKKLSLRPFRPADAGDEAESAGP